MKSMIQTIVILSLIISLPLPSFSVETKAPLEIAGFSLGSNVTDYSNIETSNFLKEVVVNDWRGFRKGIISYGICDSPGEIVKIKMKYQDTSKKYYKSLLKRFKKKFGEPDTWKGDSFGIQFIWKWRFIDEQGNTVHLLLHHNQKNPNANMGNMIKLFYPEKIQKERDCFNNQCDSRLPGNEGLTRDERMKHDWDDLIPR